MELALVLVLLLYLILVLFAQIALTYDSANGKVVIAYDDYGNSDYGTAIVGTVSGTSIGFGSAVVYNSTEVSIVSTYDSTNSKVVIALSGCWTTLNMEQQL